jgi:hypothetical protein
MQPPAVVAYMSVAKNAMAFGHGFVPLGDNGRMARAE